MWMTVSQVYGLRNNPIEYITVTAQCNGFTVANELSLRVKAQG